MNDEKIKVLESDLKNAESAVEKLIDRETELMEVVKHCNYNCPKCENIEGCRIVADIHLREYDETFQVGELVIDKNYPPESAHRAFNFISGIEVGFEHLRRPTVIELKTMHPELMDIVEEMATTDGVTINRYEKFKEERGD